MVNFACMSLRFSLIFIINYNLLLTRSCALLYCNSLPGSSADAQNDESPKSETKAPAKVATPPARRVGRTKEQLAKEREENTIVLSEDDNLWCEFRHRHIAEVMHDVNKKFREFKAQNKMASLQDKSKPDSGSSSVKDMIAAMKEMPTYKAMMKKYHKHMSLAQGCMQLFDGKSLRDLGELEQDMATGLDNDGKSISEKAIKVSFLRFLRASLTHSRL
jgi:hypothetical protein